ncbi:IDEAL domain-containing protein [Terribacillus halophilus]|uniref:IDEAL domain-containing protein n=1 Tax=Terribacillus halophilus TaxID=361279 RepID=A0A1G6P8X2_9BACI|nr:IDEAL domain-containing protein [Terribacillus halophilus]SDC76431.1 IDEAL domain-containing protein [Terribacillus halophilus]
MKKHKVVYRLQRTKRKRPYVTAKREISFEVKLATRLMLDEFYFTWNKNRLEAQINACIDNKDEERFRELSAAYRPYVLE